MSTHRASVFLLTCALALVVLTIVQGRYLLLAIGVLCAVVLAWVNVVTRPPRPPAYLNGGRRRRRRRRR